MSLRNTSNVRAAVMAGVARDAGVKHDTSVSLVVASLSFSLARFCVSWRKRARPAAENACGPHLGRLRGRSPALMAMASESVRSKVLEDHRGRTNVYFSPF